LSEVIVGALMSAKGLDSSMASGKRRFYSKLIVLKINIIFRFEISDYGTKTVQIARCYNEYIPTINTATTVTTNPTVKPMNKWEASLDTLSYDFISGIFNFSSIIDVEYE
jgi:hypothetical protein